jgi:hypothetical protein
MFLSRLHVVWLCLCFVVASVWSFVVLVMVFSHWHHIGQPGLPFGSNLPGLAAFFLTRFTLPVVGFYVAGVAAYQVLRGLRRLSVWTFRLRRAASH